mgnify:CR=1 FL=1
MKKNPQENQQVTNPSNKERYHNRYREMNPDLDLENEDAFYEFANTNLDELENYRKHNNDLVGTFSKNKAFASMLMAAKNGEDPYEWMAANLGADISELLADPEYAKKVTDSIPVGFYGEPEDCAGIVSLLCSDEGRYITGQNIFVDGGKSVQ